MIFIKLSWLQWEKIPETLLRLLTENFSGDIMQRSGWLSERDTEHTKSLNSWSHKWTSSPQTPQGNWERTSHILPNLVRCTSTNNFSKDNVFSFDFLVNNCKNIRLIYNEISIFKSKIINSANWSSQKSETMMLFLGNEPDRPKPIYRQKYSDSGRSINS